MHSGCVLLTKAANIDEAQEKVKDFLNGYEGQVWDWYVIGGRWSGSLNVLSEKFFEEVRKRFPPVHKWGYSTDDMEKHKDDFGKLWCELGGEGLNPYARDTYNHAGDFDDIVPLSECIEIVKRLLGDPIEQIKTLRQRAEEARTQDEKENHQWKSESYYLRQLADMMNQSFYFGCSVYNMEDYNYSIPEDLKNWWAVQIDMHN